MKRFTYIFAGILIALGATAFAANNALQSYQGGTGTSTAPTTGQVLVGQSNGTYAPQATSTLGISGGTGVSNAYASSTFPSFGYASSTFSGFSYGSSTYYLDTNPSGYITSSGAPVQSVSNSDGSLTISPTSGSVVSSINLAHANSWTGQQTFSNNNVLVRPDSSRYVTTLGEISTYPGIWFGTTVPDLTNYTFLYDPDNFLSVVNSPAAGAVNLRVGNDSTNQVTLDSSKNLIVGAPYNATSLAKLHVVGNGYFSGNIAAATTTFTYAANIGGDENISGALRFNASPGTAGNVLMSNGSAAPTWVATSTLGLGGGGSSPFTDDGIKITQNNLGEYLTLGTTTGSRAKLSLVQGFGSTSPLFDIASTTSALFATSSIFNVQPNGFVGLGTSSPATQLSISASTTVGAIYVSNSSVAGSISQASLLAPLSTGDVFFTVGKSLTAGSSALIGRSITGNSAGYAFITTFGRVANDFAVATTGNVGIGTSSPSSRLQIEGLAGTGTILMVASSTNASLFRVDSRGHEMTGGGTPSCGTTCASVTGDDNTMIVKSSSGAATSMTVNFYQSWVNASSTPVSPACTADQGAAGVSYIDASTTPTVITLTTAGTLGTGPIIVICRASDNFSN